MRSGVTFPHSLFIIVNLCARFVANDLTLSKVDGCFSFIPIHFFTPFYHNHEMGIVELCNSKQTHPFSGIFLYENFVEIRMANILTLQYGIHS